MRPFAVAGIQLNVLDRKQNLEVLESTLDHLLRGFPWVEMVLLSELAVSGHHLEEAEPLPGPLEERFRELARLHGIWFVPGSIYEAQGSDIYNTTSVIDPDGRVVGRHRKLFPFLPYEQGVTAGTEPLVFDVPDIGRFGISNCYDIWFPETSRWLVAQGTEVILHPSWTETIDRHIELAICRATAAVNQCYVLDVNGVGEGGNGRSIFVGPEGNVLHMAGTVPEVFPMEIDLDRVSRSREVGLRGLGQPLKSFRDTSVRFPQYADHRTPFLDTLGPLAKQTRRTRAGISIATETEMVR